MKTSTTSNRTLRTLTAAECQKIGGGLLTPDQNPSDFPVWVLPRINIARYFNVPAKQLVKF